MFNLLSTLTSSLYLLGMSFLEGKIPSLTDRRYTAEGQVLNIPATSLNVY